MERVSVDSRVRREKVMSGFACWCPRDGRDGIWAFGCVVEGVCGRDACRSRCGVRFSSGDGPSTGGRVKSEHAKTRQVGGGSEEVEVGVDFGFATDAGATAAVASAHEVTELRSASGRVGR